jgi:hypothetical protein
MAAALGTAPAKAAALEPASIRTAKGEFAGFNRPKTEELHAVVKLEQMIQTQTVRRTAFLYVPDLVRREFPYLKAKITLPADTYLMTVPGLQKDPLAEKIACWMDGFFEGNPRLVFSMEEVQQVASEIAAYCSRFLGFNRTALPSEFSDGELEVLGIANRKALATVRQLDASVAPQKISCFVFALLRAKEPGVADYLFALADTKNTQFLTLLPKWGYRPAKEFQKGDLVMYLQDGVPTHLGTYIEKGMVESKIGNITPAFDLHPWAALAPNYGFQLIIWRKVEKGSYTRPLSARGFMVFPVSEQDKPKIDA